MNKVKLNHNLLVTSSPHIRSSDTTSKIMTDVTIALIPAMAFGVANFGFRALAVVLTCILASVLSEYLTRKAFGRDNTIYDMSAVVTGLLLALNLPVTIPLWIAVVGSVIAVVLVKQFFGGIGQNFMNPALAARVILMVSWPTQMTNWARPGVDAVSSATPLALIKGDVTAQLPSISDLFLGTVGGSIGETSAIALLLGAAYLIIKKIISIEIPVAFIGTFGISIWIFGGEGLLTGNVLYHLFAGGLILGAFFMATDYSTSPVTKVGRIIMGIGCGLLTAIIRLYTNYPEGVSFAILLMNIVVPLIDKFTVPKVFGSEKAVGGEVKNA